MVEDSLDLDGDGGEAPKKGGKFGKLAKLGQLFKFKMPGKGAKGKKAPQAPKAAEGGKGRKLPVKWIGIGLAALVLLIALGGAGWYFFGYSEPPPEEEAMLEEPLPVVKPYDFEEIYDLESFTDIELRGGGQKRWLTVTVSLEMEKPELRDELGMNEHTVREIVAGHLAGRTFDEIGTVEGKILLRNQLLRSINGALRTGRVRNLFFTEFIVYFES